MGHAIQTLLEVVEVIQMPHEITKTGRFESLLERFLEDQGEAEHIDEIEIGKALFEERKYVEKIKDNGAEKASRSKQDYSIFVNQIWLQKF